ncbi:hypothetical protein M0R89_10445 [Halorussus limi]|uniref:Uncharacterized protein n=1 Tax=Halorussus limi TaxID=2938695 RepID=A0A8U0HQ19_9EURY|nr:hypothetical protein [Halorussus limi]UPV72967.1 hypothetical protein M0R89_10445 [Halorussus limi]
MTGWDDENHTCPECDGHLRDGPGEKYVCGDCDEEIPAKIAENADLLRDLAATDLPCAELAALLVGGGER